jgi:hypothetical protein
VPNMMVVMSVKETRTRNSPPRTAARTSTRPWASRACCRRTGSPAPRAAAPGLLSVRLAQRVQHPAPELRLGRPRRRLDSARLRQRRALLRRRRRLRVLAKHARRQRCPLRPLAAVGVGASRLLRLAVAGHHRASLCCGGFLFCGRRRLVVVRGGADGSGMLVRNRRARLEKLGGEASGRHALSGTRAACTAGEIWGLLAVRTCRSSRIKKKRR